MKNQSKKTNQTHKAINKFAMILTAAAAMVLVGCVHSESSSVIDMNTPTPTTPPPLNNPMDDTSDNNAINKLNEHLSNVTMSMAVRENVNLRFEAAADATPQSGSATQSSNSQDRVGIEDANAVSLINGQISLTIKNSGMSATWTEISTDDVTMTIRRDTAGHHLQLEKAIPGSGTLYLNAFTDIDNPITRIQEAVPQMLTVGDVYTHNAYYVRIDGRLSELVCTNEEADPRCRFSQNNRSGIFTAARDFAYIPEGTTTQIILTVGQRAESLFYREVEFNGALGRIRLIRQTSNCGVGLIGACRPEVERIPPTSPVRRITGFVGDHNFVPNEGQSVTVIADDYLIGGTWLHIPEDGVGMLEVGAFADGSEALNSLPISGTAIYSGNAYGIRLMANEPTNFSAEVRLTATFRTARFQEPDGTDGLVYDAFRGTIRGMLTGSDLPSALALENTALNRDGFFNGNTNMEGGYDGKWGGQLYGEGASSAAGTFGVSNGAGTDSFVGYFGATTE